MLRPNALLVAPAVLVAGCGWFTGGTTSEDDRGLYDFPAPPGPIESPVESRDFVLGESRPSDPPPVPAPGDSGDSGLASKESAQRVSPPTGRRPADTGQIVSKSGPDAGSVDPLAIDPFDSEEPQIELSSTEHEERPDEKATRDLPDLARLQEELRSGSDRAHALLGIIQWHLLAGNPLEADKVVGEFLPRLPRSEVPYELALALSQLYARLGDEDRKREWLDEAGKKIPSRALAIARASFAERRRGGGGWMYRPSSRREFGAGDRFHLRLELDGWSSREREGRHVIEQSIELAVRDAEGRTQALPEGSERFEVEQEFERRPNALQHTLKNLRLPDDLPPGRYELEIRVLDRNLAEGTGAQETHLEFEIQ